VKKAYKISQEGIVVVALLLPMFTDTVWFHDYASHAEIEVLRGRLHFTNREDNSYTPFGHGIFVFRKKSARKGKKLTIGLDGHRIGTSLIPRRRATVCATVAARSLANESAVGSIGGRWLATRRERSPSERRRGISRPVVGYDNKIVRQRIAVQSAAGRLNDQRGRFPEMGPPSVGWADRVT
jgi:hypothetical protein